MNIVGTPVQAGASFGLHRLHGGDGINSLDGLTMQKPGDAGEIAQHHAEAMVVRHRNAQPILGREAHGLADEIAVVEDVVQGQRRALGRAGRPRRELDVDRVIELKPRFEGHKLGTLTRRCGLGDVIEVEHARGLVRAQTDEQTRALASPWTAVARSAASISGAQVRSEAK